MYWGHEMPNAPKRKKRPVNPQIWEKVVELFFSSKLDEIMRHLADESEKPLKTAQFPFLTQEMISQANLKMEKVEALARCRLERVFAKLPLSDPGQEIHLYEIENAKN